MLGFVTQILVVCGEALQLHTFFPQHFRSFFVLVCLLYISLSILYIILYIYNFFPLCRTLTFLSATTVTWVHLHVFTSTNWQAQKVTRYTWYLSSGPAWWNHQVNTMWWYQLPYSSFVIDSLYRVCSYICGLAQLLLASSRAKCEGCKNQ